MEEVMYERPHGQVGKAYEPTFIALVVAVVVAWALWR
jgi:hypothetical protein